MGERRGKKGKGEIKNHCEIRKSVREKKNKESVWSIYFAGPRNEGKGIVSNDASLETRGSKGKGVIKYEWREMRRSDGSGPITNRGLRVNTRPNPKKPGDPLGKIKTPVNSGYYG